MAKLRSEYAFILIRHQWIAGVLVAGLILQFCWLVILK